MLAYQNVCSHHYIQSTPDGNFTSPTLVWAASQLWGVKESACSSSSESLIFCSPTGTDEQCYLWYEGDDWYCRVPLKFNSESCCLSPYKASGLDTHLMTFNNVYTGLINAVNSPFNLFLPSVRGAALIGILSLAPVRKWFGSS